MRLPVDPRLPIFDGTNYQKALYTRLYELFRDIAQAVNEGGIGGGGLVVLGTYATYAALIADHPNGTPGDAYLVGDDLYMWTGTQWLNLGPLRGPQGPIGLTGATGAVGPPGNNGLSVEIQKTATHIQWRQTGGSWANLVAIADLLGPQGVPGNDGSEVSLQKTATHIQWRLGTGAWANLVPLADITGPAGGAAASDVTVTPIAGLSGATVQLALADIQSQLTSIKTALNTGRTFDNLGGGYGL